MQSNDLIELRTRQQEVANLFRHSATICEEIADLTREQGTHGYSAADSSMLASLRDIFHGFSALPVFISTIQFTSGADEKGDIWRLGATMLRAAAVSMSERTDPWIDVLSKLPPVV